ncbi:MAG: hypothetical protein LBT64_03590, partial [Puniceicoccales bacterium]|nr:hypothetical protein [Puniceicoccales bacterium]
MRNMPEKSGVRWTASANGLGGILGILCALMGTTARATASTLWKIVSLPLTLLGPAKGVSLFIVRGAWSALKFAFAGLKKSVAFVCGGAWLALKHAKAVIPAGRALWKFTETASVGACKFFGKCCRGAWSALKFTATGARKSAAFACGGVLSLLKHTKAVIPAGRALWKFTETASVGAGKFFGKCCRGAWSALKFAFAGLKKSVAFVCGGVWSLLKKISAVPF